MEKVMCIGCDKCCHNEEDEYKCAVHDTDIVLLVDDGGDGSKSHVIPLLCIDYEPLKLDACEEGHRCSLCGNKHGYDNPFIGLLGMLDTDYNYNDIYLCNLCERKVIRDAALLDVEFIDALKANLDANKVAIREWNLQLLKNANGQNCTIFSDKDEI